MITSLTAHFTRISVGDCRDGILFFSYHEVSTKFVLSIILPANDFLLCLCVSFLWCLDIPFFPLRRSNSSIFTLEQQDFSCFFLDTFVDIDVFAFLYGRMLESWNNFIVIHHKDQLQIVFSWILILLLCQIVRGALLSCLARIIQKVKDC